MAAGSSAAASVTLLLPASVSFLSSSTPSSCPIVSLPSLPSLLSLHNKFVHTVKRPTLCARSRCDIVVHVCPMCAQTTPKSRLPSAASPCVSATRLSQHLSKVGSLSAVQQVSGSGGGACPQGEFVSRKLFWSKSKQHVQSKCNGNDSPSACVREGNDQELEGAGMRASSIRQSFITERWTEAGVTGEGEDKSVWELAMTKSGNIRKAVALQLAAAVATGLFLWVGPSALAVDPLKTCACLLKECRVELVKCIADPKCAANVACLQTCNGRPDETECQIGCGDLFENKVVDEFNDCAVTRKGCVPQKADEGRFPIPPPVALVPNFNTTDFTGQWYISSGLNRTFDTFDCQRHEFSAEPTKLTGNLAWRIPTPDGGFFTRNAVQKFVQDPQQPGILYNHGNEFLNYQDDWYILSSKIEMKPDDYVFIYYRGKNDAWDGYGGAVVYTRSKTLPTSIVPELQRAAKRVNLDFNKFTNTDNTCGPEAPLFARLEKKVEEGERFVEKEVEELEQDVEKVGRSLANAEMSLFGQLGKGAEELRRDEERFFQELGDEEKQILSDLEMEASDVGKLFGKAIPLRKLR